MNKKCPEVLVVFSGIYLYGMERGVIETFDLLRPEISPRFMMSCTARKKRLPALAELNRRQLPYTFFSDDKKEWARVERPHSLSAFWRMIVGLVKGNVDVLKAGVRADILYIPGLYYFYYSFLAAFFFRLVNRRVIYHFHDLIDEPSFQLRVASILVTDFVHNNRIGYDLVLKGNSYIQGKSNHIIPYPIYRRASVNCDEIPGTILDGKRNILFIGQLARHKGLDILIKAFHLISDKYPDASLHLIGSFNDPHFQDEIENLIGRNPDRIHLWGFREDILSFLKRAYVHVLSSPPSRCKESFGLVSVEAMSQGVPTVCFASGALQELVLNEQTGLVCQDETPDSLAAALRRLLDDRAFRNSCGYMARNRFEDEYASPRIKALWLKNIEIQQ